MMRQEKLAKNMLAPAKMSPLFFSGVKALSSGL